MNRHDYFKEVYVADTERIMEDMKVAKENRKNTITGITIAVVTFLTLLCVVFEILRFIAS